MATWTIDIIAPASTHPADDITRLTDALTLLRNNFASGTAPTGTGADGYMLWADTTNKLMKVANATASAFVVAYRLDDGSRPDDQVIWSNASDATKKAKVDLSGVGTGHTRTLKVQDRDGTMADLDDIQKDLPVYATTTNILNAFSVTLTPALTGLVDGVKVKAKMNAAPTGAATLNANGFGDVAIKKNGSTDIESGDWVSGQILEFCYDGANFQIVGKLVIVPANTAYTGNVQTSSPSNPSPLSLSSAGGELMAGLGVLFTPTKSTRVLVTIEGGSASSGTSPISINARHGTGTAPANAAAATGTTIGGTTKMTGTTTRQTFSMTRVITGLTLGTQIWLDIGTSVGTGSATNTLSDLNVTVSEA